MTILASFLAQPQPIILVIDGSSFLYRAYHALPDLRSPTGEPTGALYGMIAMLKRLRQTVPTEHVVCVFDAKGKTFRDDWYPQYKANRPKMPDDLVAQIEPIEQAVRALGFPVIVQEGVEADDVMGTLAALAQAAGWRTVMATGDKDLTQLVNEQVLWLNTMTGDALDTQGVVQKFGVPPNRIVDYLTLVGDTVDNVPGVEKVGPKTAVKWLTEYDHLDAIIANADQIGGKVGEHLRAALDWLPQARRLVTVRCDVDLSTTLPRWQDVCVQAADTAALRQLYNRSGFRTWLRELDETRSSVPAPKSDGSDLFSIELSPNSVAASSHEALATPAFTELKPFEVVAHTVTTWEAFDAMLTQIQAADLVAIDTETTALSPLDARIVGISMAIKATEGWYIPLMHEGLQDVVQLPLTDVLARLKPWLENESAAKIGQHLKYDSHVFANHGIRLAGIVHDTLLQSYVLDSTQKHALDAIGARYLGVSSLSYEDLCGKGAHQIPFAQVDIPRAAHYAVEDVALCLAVHEQMYPKICTSEALRTVYETIELPTSAVLYQMERTGVLLDASELARQSHALGQTLIELEQRAHELAGGAFNLNSPKQIGELFFEKLGMPVVKKTTKGAPSTDEEVLQKLAEDYPLPQTLLEYRGLTKLKSTYTDSLPTMIHPSSGRVHTTYGQAIAVTGRLSSNDPNLQNIPVRTEQGRKVRTAFIAPNGSVLVSADYSQIELRILAHLSQDPVLIDAFQKNDDIHTRTAAQIFHLTPAAVTSEQRRMAKVINFGLIYGMSAFGLAKNLGISRTAAQEYIDQYFIQYPAVSQYMETTRQFAREKGYVATHFGRRLYLPDINNRNMARRQSAERAAINAPMQGTSADLIKLAMIHIDQQLTRLALRSRLIMQVHDELVLEVPEDELTYIQSHLAQWMAEVATLSVPLLAEVGVGANWEAAH